MKKTALCIMMACLSLCFYPHSLSASNVAINKTATEISIDPSIGKTISATPAQIKEAQNSPIRLKELIRKNHSQKKDGPVLIISGAGLLLIIILLILLL
jgi:hypothetical protein